MMPKSKWLVLPSVRVFDDVEPSKAQVVKIAEETCEVYSAWEDFNRTRRHGEDWDMFLENNDAIMSLVDECCDTIRAVCNLLASLGITDLTEAMAACRKRNADRGRITK